MAETSNNDPTSGRQTVSGSSETRASDPAWVELNPAGLGEGARLRKWVRPQGPVHLPASDGLQLAVRINLLARERSMARPDPARLKACLSPDYYLLAPAGEAAVITGHSAQEILLLSLPPSAFHRNGLMDHGCPLSPLSGRVLVDPVITGLVEQLARSSSAQDAALNASVIDTLLLTLVQIARTRPRDSNQGGLTGRQLALLRDHVEARLDRPIRNADLAALTGLSPFHFARSFKASMGVPPAGWIRLRRLTVAQRLLGERERSITDVAASVGYDSPSRFARAFRDATGVSPSQFRRAQA